MLPSLVIAYRSTCAISEYITNNLFSQAEESARERLMNYTLTTRGNGFVTPMPCTTSMAMEQSLVHFHFSMLLLSNFFSCLMLHFRIFLWSMFIFTMFWALCFRIFIWLLLTPSPTITPNGIWHVEIYANWQIFIKILMTTAVKTYENFEELLFSLTVKDGSWNSMISAHLNGQICANIGICP